ncbi:MAG TPA: YkgJ family cysteine cluster protein [Candidatus Thermoplasmatota archaeon]|nr:YkgJ family cysteine cluster protein [Candidatus Thermoplasmatota archaeon]
MPANEAPLPLANPCLANACSACCRDTEMPLSAADVARLESATRRPASDFAQTRDGLLRLRNVAGACVFLRQGRCSVYDARPEGCRLYPFVWAQGEGVRRDADCPYRSAFQQGADVPARLQTHLARLGLSP